MNQPSRPRVVWVDDDPAIRHLVALVLEDEDLELVLCANVAQARAALSGRKGLEHGRVTQSPVALLVTDLMMPNESGFDLLDSLAGTGLPRTVVFSARLDDDTQSHLSRWGVWRHLVKPTPVADLLACVRDGLGLHRAWAAGAGEDADADADAGKAAAASAVPVADEPAAVMLAPTASTVDLGPPSSPDAQRRARALANNFGGDSSLFDAFEAACQKHFVHDLQAGDQAAAAVDGLAALRLLGHSLKSVLLSLGHDAAAADARRLELAVDCSAAGPAWAALRQALVDI